MEWADEKLYLNSFKKWRIWLYLISATFILLLSFNGYADAANTNKASTIIVLIAVIIFMVGLGEFLHSLKFEGFVGLLFYISQLLILFIYMLTFIMGYLEDVSNVWVLIIIVIMFIAYSFLFVKNVVDSFKSFLFQFLNFIFILLFSNMIGIGLTFGAFYLENNEVFGLFSENDLSFLNSTHLEDSFDRQSLNALLIIYKGLDPFFNFPSELAVEHGFMGFIPLIEHIIGSVFNLFIIGFFVSYSVNKLFERKEGRKQKERSECNQV